MKQFAENEPSYIRFDSTSYAWKPDVDYKVHPELYKVGKGEQGVLICEPYKSELVKFWKFKTPDLATESSKKILKMFFEYLREGDFVGADMARKYLQMGYTRARRYANYSGGVKYDKDNGYSLNPRGTGDKAKAESAEIFNKAWHKAEADAEYARQKKEWKKTFG